MKEMINKEEIDKIVRKILIVDKKVDLDTVFDPFGVIPCYRKCVKVGYKKGLKEGILLWKK